MEPVSAVVGAAALGAVAVYRTKRVVDGQRLRRRCLPEALVDDGIADACELRVVAVRIHDVRLAPTRAKQVKLRVKFGRPGLSVAGDTDDAPVVARAGGRGKREEGLDLGATCLFYADARLSPRLRFRLLEAEGCRSALGEAEVDISGLSSQVLQHQSLALMKPGARTATRIGHFSVAVSAHTVPKGQLRVCLAQVHAQLQGAAVVVPSASPAEGVVVEDLEAKQLRGGRVRAATRSEKRLLHGPQRFRLQGLCGIA